MKKGFTIIEVIVYTALFAVIMTSGFSTALLLMQGSDNVAAKIDQGEETSFVLRKINWLLSGNTTGVTVISSPSSGMSYATTLTVSKAGAASNPFSIRFNAASSSIEMKEGVGSYLPLTTQNVKVTSLGFVLIQGVGGAPDGIVATITIDGVTSTTTRYIRK